MRTSCILRILLPIGVAVVAVAGCNADDKRELGEQDVRDSLRASVEDVLTERSTSVDGGLDCTSTIGSDGAVEGSCSGTTASGEAVVLRYVGLADIDAETCSATMAVSIGGVALDDRAGVDCFAG
jgi:hypothetical protein